MSNLSILVALAAALVIAGLWLAVVGMQKSLPPPPGPRRSLPGVSAVHRVFHPSPRSQKLLLAGLGAGILITLLTGWAIAIVAVPLAFVGLPYLMGASEENFQTARLEAMEEWTRSLAGVLTVGSGLEQAIIITLRSAPGPIFTEVETLVARLRARWPTEAAIRAFADDLNDATGDRIAANLLLNAQRRGPGLAVVLENLAESVAMDVRTRRAVEADRAKPRATARWITIITVVCFGGLMFNGNFVQPYRSVLGQAILAMLLVSYVVILVWMRTMTRGSRMPRFIGNSVADRSGL